MGKVTLKTNVPVEGTVQYVDFYPAKPNPQDATKQLGPDLGLKGMWDGSGAGTVYVNARLLETLTQQGMVSVSGWDQMGAPIGLRWTYQGRVRVLREEGQGNRKLTTITPLNGAAPAPVAMPAPTMQQTLTPAPSPAPNGAGHRDWWAGQYRLMRFCLEQAYAVHGKVSPESAADHDVVASTAHSLFIQANRDRVPALAGD